MYRAPRLLTLAGLLLIASSTLAGPPEPPKPVVQPTQRKSDLARGRELYERHCLACHGEHGEGDGPATAQLVAPVPNLFDKLPQEPDDDAVSALLAGGGAMPSFAQSLDRYDARRVLRWMARTSAPSADPAPSSPPVQDP